MNEDVLPRTLDAATGRPKGTTWGLFGESYQLGTLNFLTPERIRNAAGLIRNGRRFSLNLPLDEPPRSAGRGTCQPLRHTICHTTSPDGVADPVSNDDILDNFNTQSSTQWDGFGHVLHPRLGHYNGVHPEDVRPGRSSRHSIGTWVDAGAIAGRGVLVDLPRYFSSIGDPYNPGERRVIDPETLDRALASEGVDLCAGDILLVRTGAMQRIRDGGPAMPTPGLGPGREMGEHLWAKRIAAVASDTPSFEPSPIDPTGPRSMHMQLVVMIGMPIGELFYLEQLAEECASELRHEFFFVSVPLNIPGGAASPANAIAIM